MDYCSSCRRYLNGALVCPGCGAYAPDIAPPVASARAPLASAGAAAGPAAGWEVTASGEWHSGRRPDGPRVPADVHYAPGMNDMDGVHGMDAPHGVDEAPRGEAGVVGVAPARMGRAARRRRLARWKKTQRRALVATAVAMVGGGLTLASMDQHTGDGAQAASAPDSANAGSVGGLPPQHVLPDSPTPDARQSSPASSAPRRTDGRAHGQSAPAPQGSTAPAVRPDSAASRTSAPTTGRTAAGGSAGTTSAAQGTGSLSSSTGRTASGGSGTATQPSTAPTGSDSTGSTSGSGTATGSGSQSGSGSTSGSGSGSTQTSPTTDPTSPSQLCLLVVCLG
ncbi:hypothetical protein ACF1A5_09235 [Streptomyces sp. NPDC014864]|uniref:SCO2400 family protein n=1 Tax=Streptomyces sp. NPDC014864 TaxID=3364924 RepID=UPI0036F62BB2